MAYNTYTETRVLPNYAITMEFVSTTSYMEVEAVLRWLNIVGNPFLTQYQLIIEGVPTTHNFFKCEDIKAKIGAEKFRLMECDVSQHMFLDK